MDHAELELTLRAPADGRVYADVRLGLPGGVSTADLTLGAPVTFDVLGILALSLSPDAYGRSLTDQLFAAPQLREAWATVRGYIQGAKMILRFRLRIDPGAAHLHALRWELLQDPFTHTFLCQSERVRFARVLDTDDLAAPITPQIDTLRALVAIANPADLEEFNLAPIDSDGEATRTRQALADLPVTLLSRSSDGAPATLARITDALRDGHTLLYLICHGTIVRGRPILWLECDDGTADRVAGDMLVQRIADLPPDRRPRLIVLAACQTAGRQDAGTVLATLGPQLARAGVGAVIGMQGDVPMVMVERLMPRLFRLLRADGAIDRALAIARTDLPPDWPWWMPVLYLRIRDGQLWADPPAQTGDQPSPVPRLADGLDALIGLLQSPTVRETVAAFRSEFATTRTQVADLIALKDVHDVLHTLQFQCYIPLTREARGFPDDDLAIENMRDYALTLHTRTAEILDVFTRAPEVLGPRDWVSELTLAYTNLEQALAERNHTLLRRVFWQINRVLAVQPSYINANLIARARGLRLRTLVDAMHMLSAQLSQVVHDHGRLTRFNAGVAALVDLRRRLSELIADHDAWQSIDREMRRIAESLRHDTAELELSWPDLVAHLTPLTAGDAVWATALRAEADRLSHDIAAADAQRAGAIFQRCNRIIGERFYQVDVDLKRLCSQLRELGDPLNELERMLG